MKRVLIYAFAVLTGGMVFAYPAVDGLIGRVIPAHKNQIVLKDGLPLSENGTDAFSIASDSQGRLVLAGSSPVAQASALGWYLRHVAGCEVSWEGAQLNLPETLPAVKAPIRKTTPHAYRPYLNYCTLSYTAAFWDWARWEREIDLMALNGINMPLAAVGLEGVWFNVLQQFGFSEAEAQAFLAGPSYSAWQWMTNLEGYGGPLPKSWIESHIALGRKIIDRELEFGMKPIQQGFTGYVPVKMREKFPEAVIKIQPSWCGTFKGSAQLDPLDPLFGKLAAAFYAEQKRLFGAHGHYGTDPFHEGQPPQPGKEYLGAVGKAIYEAAVKADAGATLCMQSWSLRKEIMQAVPKEHMLVLDIGGRSWGPTQAFWGYPFVVGIIHNFGGRTRLFGDLAALAENPFMKAKERAPNCVGMGLFPEAIQNNPAYFALAFDFIWRDGPVNFSNWLGAYTARRYGIEDPAIDAAWRLLVSSLYNPKTAQTRGGSLICAAPMLNVYKSDPNNNFAINYAPAEALAAWEALLSVADRVKNAPGYTFDVADVGRQVMGDTMMALHCDAVNAYFDADIEAYRKAVATFRAFALDFDALLKTQPILSFEKWVEAARAWGATPAEQDLYAFNAAMQITQWGYTINRPTLSDYAWKEWSGLLRDYHLQRWIIFYAELEKHLLSGTPWPDESRAKSQDYGRPAYRTTPFMNTLADFEDPWIRSPHLYPPYAPGASVTESRRILEKWGETMKAKLAENPMRQLGRVKERITARNGELIGKAAFTWTPKDCDTHWKTWEVGVTPLFQNNGTYEITFEYTRGNAKVEIAEVTLLQNGLEISTDAHPGFAGLTHTANTYRLTHADPIIGAEFTLKARVRTHGSADSTGTIRVRHVK